MTKKISLETTVQYTDEKLIVSDLGDESVMMNIESGDYFGLNDIGTEIWHLIKDPINVQTLCDKLLEEFDISAEACQKATLEYLEQLQKEEMIVVQ